MGPCGEPWARSTFLRSEGDSNSRYPFGVYKLSRFASSATRASLLIKAVAVVSAFRVAKVENLFETDKSFLHVVSKFFFFPLPVKLLPVQIFPGK